MFLSRNKENNIYPCKPQFYHTKMGFKEINIIFRHVYFTAAGVKCRVEAVKRIPVLHRSADYIYTGGGCPILKIRLSTTIIPFYSDND